MSNGDGIVLTVTLFVCVCVSARILIHEMPMWLQISWTTPPIHPHIPYIPYAYQQISITKNTQKKHCNHPKSPQIKNETPKTIPFSDTLFPHLFLHYILPLAHLIKLDRDSRPLGPKWLGVHWWSRTKHSPSPKHRLSDNHLFDQKASVALVSESQSGCGKWWSRVILR